MNMIETIQEYSGLINIGLFGVIIGWLFHISRLSRTSIIDKYEAMLAAKDQNIEALNQLIINKEENFKSQLAVSEHSRSFFEKLASLPEDDAVQALKLEYELRLVELEKKESEVVEESDKEEVKEEISQLKNLKDSVSSIMESGGAIIEAAKIVSRLMY